MPISIGRVHISVVKAPSGDITTESVTHGHYDAKPTFAVTMHRCSLVSTKLNV